MTRIFLIAAEPSGDVLGARLIAALRDMGPIEVAGVGGAAMAAQGLVSLFDPADLAIVGLIEAVPKIPQVFRRIGQTLRHALDFKPDVVVTIDSPSFSLEVAERLRKRAPAIPLVHYAAPQVWAWKAWRAKAMAGYLDHLLALLPFEPPFFARHGLPTTFVGHPAAGEPARDVALGTAFRAAQGLPADMPLLAMLPGSRRGEVKKLLPIFRATAAKLASDHPDLGVVIPTVSPVAALVRAAAADFPLPTCVVDGTARAGLYHAADVALTASGTATLELAAAGLPMVVTYRVAPITAAIARRILQVRYAALPNLILDKLAVPELLQDQAEPGMLAAKLDELLSDAGARARQRADLDAVALALGRGGPDPAQRAADVVAILAREGSRFA